MEQEADTGLIENATFFESESANSTGDLENGYDDEFGDRGQNANQMGKRVSVEANNDAFGEKLRKDELRQSQFETDSFWERNDLLLDTLPDNATPTYPKRRFRYVDSRNVSTPDLPSSVDLASPPSSTLEWAGRDNGALRRGRRVEREIDIPDESQSNRKSFIPDPYRTTEDDIRRPDRNARELNGIGQTNEDWLAVRHIPPANRFLPLKTMPVETLNLMFGHKAVEVNRPEANTGQDDASASTLTKAASGKLWPFLLATGGLIASLAFNFYLGFVAWDTHLRYRDICSRTERLRIARNRQFTESC